MPILISYYEIRNDRILDRSYHREMSLKDVITTLEAYMERRSTDYTLRLTPFMKCIDACGLQAYKTNVEASVWPKFQDKSRKVPIDKLATTFIDGLAIDIVQKKAMAERAPAHIDDRAVACVASFIRLKIAARAGYPVVETPRIRSASVARLYTGSKTHVNESGKDKDRRRHRVDAQNHDVEGTYSQFVCDMQKKVSLELVTTTLKAYMERGCTDNTLRLTPFMKCIDACGLHAYQTNIEAAVWPKFQDKARRIPIDKIATCVIDAIAVDVVHKKTKTPRAADVRNVAREIRERIAARAGHTVVESPKVTSPTVQRLTDISSYTGTSKHKLNVGKQQCETYSRGKDRRYQRLLRSQSVSRPLRSQSVSRPLLSQSGARLIYAKGSDYQNGDWS